MFNKKLKKRIVELEKQNEELYKKQFRVGDLVYINDKKILPTEPVYLRTSYNNGTCYYVTKETDGIVLESSQFAFHVSRMSHTPPKKCHCCGAGL